MLFKEKCVFPTSLWHIFMISYKAQSNDIQELPSSLQVPAPLSSICDHGASASLETGKGLRTWQIEKKPHFYSWEGSIAYVDLGKRISEFVEDSGKPFEYSVTCSLETLESLFSLRLERCWSSCCIWLWGTWGRVFWSGWCNLKERWKRDWWANQTVPGAALGNVEELLDTCDGQENHFEANGHMQTDDKTTG